MHFFSWFTHYFPAFCISSHERGSGQEKSLLGSFSMHRNNWWGFQPFLTGLLMINHTLPYRTSYGRRRKKLLLPSCVDMYLPLWVGELILAISLQFFFFLRTVFFKVSVPARYVINEYWLNDSTWYIVASLLGNAKEIFLAFLFCRVCSLC